MFIEKRIHLYGTINQIKLFGITDDSIFYKLFDLMKFYDKLLSANNPVSNLMEVNQNAGLKSVRVSNELYHLISYGLKHSLDDNSQLNIAIGPLVKLWKIGFKEQSLPNHEKIQEVLHYCDPKKIILDKKQSSIYLEKNMEIDLGAIAKGYIADKLVEFLRCQGIVSGFINLGGNIKCFGYHPFRSDKNWHIGIQKPFEKRGEEIGKLITKEGAIVTSGVYERNFTCNQKIFHHLFDQKTGYPITSNQQSLTIISPSALDADTWATKLFGLSNKKISENLKNQQNLQYISISQKNNINMSPTLQGYFIKK